MLYYYRGVVLKGNRKETPDMTREYRAIDTIKDMTESILANHIDENTHRKIEKAIDINYHYTSTYALEFVEVMDIKGHNSSTSGFYINLLGTGVGVKFFINNDLRIVRKPRNAETQYTYRFKLTEDFYGRHF